MLCISHFYQDNIHVLGKLISLKYNSNPCNCFFFIGDYIKENILNWHIIVLFDCTFEFQSFSNGSQQELELIKFRVPGGNNPYFKLYAVLSSMMKSFIISISSFLKYNDPFVQRIYVACICYLNFSY